VPPHPKALRRARSYLAVLDRAVPGRVVGLHLVGSAALASFRPDRSDVDLVVVLDRHRPGDCALIRAVHRRSALRTFPPGLLQRGRSDVPGVCNAVFIASDDLTRPVRSIEPIGSHVGLEVECEAAFDVNPVVWTELRDHGIALRGPDPASLGLDPEEDALAAWNLDNLRAYWRPLASALLEGRAEPRLRLRPRWTTSWVTLGTARMHHTIATGEIIGKDAAGENALATFDARWHPIIREGLAARQGGRRTGAFTRSGMVRQAGAFGLHVVDRAEALVG
jgi:hypothetical protein